MFFAMWVSSTLIGILAGGAAYLFLEFFLPKGAELQRSLAFWGFAAMGFSWGLYGACWFMIKNWRQVSELQAIAKKRDTSGQ